MDSLDILRKLVGFDTTSSRSNLALIDWVANIFEDLGAKVSLIRDDYSDKANILATIGPGKSECLLLSGHTDVVPVDDQEWDTDPFVLTSRNDKLYGRGTADMKGFIACCLEFAESEYVRNLTRPISFSFTYDEEVGCLGAPSLIAELGENHPPPGLVVVGEPTNLQIVDSHKGVYLYETLITGHGAHSSKPQLGCSAIKGAVNFASFLYVLAERMSKQVSELPGLDPACSTLNIGVVNGGTAINVVSDRCRLSWEIRPIPEFDIEEFQELVTEYLNGELLSDLKRENQNADVELTQLVTVPPLLSTGSSEAVRSVQALTGDSRPSTSVNFGTEAGLFQEAGFPTIVCGPGSIQQAHQPNEWLLASQLSECRMFLERIGRWASSSP